MTTRMPFYLLAVLVLALPACGGGSSAPPDDGAPSGKPQTIVLIEPEEPGEIDEIAAETGAEVLGPVPGTPYWRVAIPPGMTVEAFIQQMGDDARVVNADEDLALSVPEGDGSTLPAGGLLVASMIPLQPDLIRIGIEAAHTRSTGMGVRVAVLDTGVIAHESLDGHVDPDGWDFVDDDPNPTDVRNGRDDDGDGLVDEGYAHGTFVSSLILAVAPDCRIVPFRVLDADGTGRVSTLASAVTLAASRGVDVINLSVSMAARVKVLQDAVQSARAMGVQVIASAGNTGADDVSFPAALSQAFSVTAVDANDIRAPFASYGGELDLTAPGVDLHGAYPSPTGTARWSGSSFSAALVSGAFALVRQLDPMGSPDALLQRIANASVPIDALNPAVSGELGHGRLDLDAATGP